MSTDGETTFTFLGSAHPERVGWWFDRFKVREPGGVILEAEMRGSRFVARLTVPESAYGDLLTARNHAASHVRAVVDAIGLVNGAAISCEISEAIDPHGALHALDPSIEELAVDDADISIPQIVAAAFNDRSLRLGMADLRSAILDPSDTAFLCYRAIEGVRNNFDTWEEFRSAFDVPYDEAMKLKALADPRRHGRSEDLSHDQRIESLQLLHRVLLRRASQVWASLPTHVRYPST